MNVRLVPLPQSWVVEELDAKGEVERRFGYDTEERARAVYLRKVATRTGTIQAMLFGVGVDGVGEAPLFGFETGVAVIKIEPMTWHKAVMGLGTVVRLELPLEPELTHRH